MTFGEKVRSLRKEKKMSQQELASIIPRMPEKSMDLAMLLSTKSTVTVKAERGFVRNSAEPATYLSVHLISPFTFRVLPALSADGESVRWQKEKTVRYG